MNAYLCHEKFDMQGERQREKKDIHHRTVYDALGEDGIRKYWKLLHR